MCAEHSGDPHWDDETNSEQFSLRGIKIMFQQFYDNLNIVFVFLNKVGGSVGLWLGLGVLQAGEILTNFFLAKVLPHIVEKISRGDQIQMGQ